MNNAGSLSGSDNFLQTTPEQWEQSFRVNLLGPMMFSKAAIPEIRVNGGGSIVNIGSTGSLGAEAPGYLLYQRRLLIVVQCDGSAISLLE